MLINTALVRKITAYLALKQTYWIGVGAVLSFNVSVVMFALVPLLPVDPNPLLLSEIIVATGAGLSICGVLLHAIGNRTFIARWAFLSSVFSVFMTMVAFSVFETEAMIWTRITVFFYLLTGLFISTCLHIEFGGNNPIEESPQSIPEELL